jgi:hypothetical protein
VRLVVVLMHICLLNLLEHAKLSPKSCCLVLVVLHIFQANVDTAQIDIQ